jgi:uncharacterized cupin superfamily protein
MKALHLHPDGRGESRATALPLPFLYTGPAVTPGDNQPTGLPAPAFRAVSPVRFDHPVPEKSGDTDVRRLDLVVSGRIGVSTAGGRAVLSPGDVLLVDDGGARGRVLQHSEGCRVLRVDVAPGWAPVGTVPPPVESPTAPADRSTHLLEMYVADDVAHFRDFSRLFDGSGQGPAQVLDALKFIVFSAGHAGDWHTDKNTNVVLVLAGILELEVGGESAVELFFPGDVCLVQDLVGQGHVLRAHGETRIAALTVPDAHRWSVV